ncbi:MAG: hypothetical protein K8R34_16520 [Methanosarcinales archaeon]|nr:hypothetical protein [Methanosarcinales archaeon]
MFTSTRTTSPLVQIGPYMNPSGPKSMPFKKPRSSAIKRGGSTRLGSSSYSASPIKSRATNRRPSSENVMGLTPGATNWLVQTPSSDSLPTSPVRNDVQYSEPSGPKMRSSGPSTPISGPILSSISPVSGSITTISLPTIEVMCNWSLLSKMMPAAPSMGDPCTRTFMASCFSSSDGSMQPETMSPRTAKSIVTYNSLFIDVLLLFFYFVRQCIKILNIHAFEYHHTTQASSLFC